VFLKKWKGLYVNLSWLGRPHDFNDYYSGYVPSANPLSGLNGNYAVSVSLLNDGEWYQKKGYIGLFHRKNKSYSLCCHNRYDESFRICPEEFHGPGQVFDPNFTPITKYATDTQRGFLRMTLEKQDFLHKYYAWAMAQAIAGNVKSSGTYGVVNEPWTPTIIPGMSIDYTASAKAEDMTLVQLYPFAGTSKVVNISGRPELMANFCHEGNLYIGLAGLLPGQGLSMLFQLAEATGESEASPGKVRWHYLANNEWKELRPGFELVQDGTNGLTRTGILQFAFPDDISNSNTVLTAGNYWISAGVRANAATTSRTIAIVTQAGLATYVAVAGVNDPLRAATPLAAQSISKLTQPDANVIKVVQPYASFGGSAPEDAGNAYPTRVSEQLRHKGRAIQKWDYERLVLQQFPMLSRVKCINHGYCLNSNQYKYDFPMSPANILVAVLPDTSQLTVADQLHPTVPTSMLKDIETFLSGVKSPFVTVAVANPRYEPVTICVNVVLQPAESVAVCAVQLQQAIQAFLAPWLDGDMDRFQFGQPLYLSDIASLIEGQSYVAYLNNLNMSHADEDMGAEPPDQLSPRTPRSILVAGAIYVKAVEPTDSESSSKNSAANANGQ
jgi:hypothetical protein